VTRRSDETPEELRARALAKMQEVYGWEFGDDTSDFFGYTADHLFADIWSREGLTQEQRRLLLIGMLAGQGKMDVLNLQLDVALRVGDLTGDELREIAIFMCHYAGWPTGSAMHTTIEGMLSKQK
jgi:4-carboxymuconolactone decarboxylase